jgi:ferredoxin
VQVCPTGIDIRNGLQLECIACAACIDACDQVMDKVGSPRGLIRYSTENALAKHYTASEMFAHLLRRERCSTPASCWRSSWRRSWSLAHRVPLEGGCPARPLDAVARGGRRAHRERVSGCTFRIPTNLPIAMRSVSAGIDGIEIVGERSGGGAGCFVDRPIALSARVEPRALARRVRT